MRALLIVNPRATSTTQARREVIARALASELDLQVVLTRYRGHASRVAEEAAKSGYHLLITLGGDGTVNEAANGLLRAHPPAGNILAGRRADGHPPAGPGAGEPPMLAAIPGGNANVFSRALGLPADPVDATGRILGALSCGSSRAISVGRAGDRYFCFNAGLGIDAEVVRVVEGLRAHGRPVSTTLYLRAATRQFYWVTDRRRPALTLEPAGGPAVPGLFCGIVSNTAPWTYLGHCPVNASPQAGFDTGLDLFALRKLSTLAALGALWQMLAAADGPHGRQVVSLHDQPELRFRASRPVALQVDGEYVGEREDVTFEAIPSALRVVV